MEPVAPESDIPLLLTHQTLYKRAWRLLDHEASPGLIGQGNVDHLEDTPSNFVMCLEIPTIIAILGEPLRQSMVRNLTQQLGLSASAKVLGGTSRPMISFDAFLEQMEEARATRLYAPNPPHQGHRRIDMLIAAFRVCHPESEGPWQSSNFEKVMQMLNLPIAGRKACDELQRRIAEMEELHPKGSIAAFAATLFSPNAPLPIQSFLREIQWMYGSFAIFDHNSNGLVEPIEFGQTITEIFGWRPP